MRKSLFLTAVAIAALTLAGCQKTEPVSGLGDNDAIGFAPYVSRDVTKASVTDLTASNFTSFNVACYLTGSANTYFASEQTVSKKASGIWETADTYLWPESAKLDFFAYSGSGSGAVSNTGGVAKVAYTVPDAGTEDFVVSCSINQGKPSASPYAQSLSFSHALSKVSQLTLAPVTGGVGESSKYKYIVTDVRISGAKNSADYSFNPASGGNWGTASGDKDYAFDDNSFNFLGDSSHKLEAATEVNDQLIVLPQTAAFSVTYSVEYLGDDGTTWHKVMASATKTADIDLEAGNAYAVRLQLPVDGSPIVFGASVAEWGDAVEVEKEAEKNIVLNGDFTVNSSGDKVNFSRGNLYYTGSAFKFEYNQYSYPSTWDTGHIGHFRWAENSGTLSTDITSAIDTGTSLSGTNSDIFFTNATQTTPRTDFTAEGETGRWRTLSGGPSGEWYYLLNSRSGDNAPDINGTTDCRYAEVKVNSICGMLIFPDTFTWPSGVSLIPSTFNVRQTSWNSIDYTVAEFTLLENAGCVFLPAAGLRSGSARHNVGSFGCYWSSSPDISDTGYTYYLFFYNSTVSPASYNDRYFGYSVRLVSAAR